MRKVLTYGTYDLLHYGHMNILKAAKSHGDYLIVGLSSDEFNELKNKTSVMSYDERKEFLENIKYVDMVIKEDNWEQKIDDVKTYHVDVVVMGSDWAGSDRFEYLNDYCEVVYLDRTEGISTTKIKQELGLQEPVNGVDQIPETKK
ncbi:MAG: adenylyltransferase/cytidyltransferase family protein [Candidatus Faecisoma sp.]|nr:adenylyltransferase/cytidyltransferase family protein [Candidatus Faecisoma sp.]